MLEGLEISILNLREVLIDNSELRTDSEFFSKKYLEADIFLKTKKSEKISKYAKVSDGDHNKFPDNQIDEVRYLQAKDIKNHLIIDENPVFISNEYFIKNKRSHIFEENVILSIMGSVGDIAITPKGFTPSLANRAIAIIKDIKEVNPYYLFAYLSSKFGQLQIDRQKNGGVQERINLDVLSKVKIPNVGNDFQLFIEKTVKQSHLKDKLSKQAYSSADTLLLESLCLKDFDPSTDGINVESYKESFLATGRLDAEYYQKKYEETKAEVFKSALKSEYEIVSLKDIASNPKYGSSEKLEYLESGVPFLRIADLEDKRFNRKNLKFISKEAAKEEASARVKTNDILISRSGTLGLSVLIQEDLNDSIYGSYFIKITPEVKKIDPKYLTFYLNSKIGQIQVEQENTGGIQTNLTIPVIESLYIIIPDKETQGKIVGLIEESFRLKKQSEQLLETAKRAVELAIEQDEEEAMRYIETRTKI